MLNNLSIRKLANNGCGLPNLRGQCVLASEEWDMSWIPATPVEDKIILHFVFIFLVFFLLEIFDFFGIVAERKVNYDCIKLFGSTAIFKQFEFAISLNIFHD